MIPKIIEIRPLGMQSAHACAVQTHFFVFALRPEKWSKKPPKMEPRGTPNHKKSRKMGTEKNTKNCIQKVSKMTSTRDSFFAAERSPKSQKSEVSSKWAPRPPKWAPGVSKITENEPLGIQNDRKLTSQTRKSYCKLLVFCILLSTGLRKNSERNTTADRRQVNKGGTVAG